MTDKLDSLVDSIADDFIKVSVNPHYLTIRRVLIRDNVTGERSFADRYGTGGMVKFKRNYRRFINEKS